MAFILSVGYGGHQNTIANYLVSILREYGVESSVVQTDKTIVCRMNDENPRLQESLEVMGKMLPYSIFMSATSHKFEGENPASLPEYFETLPLGLGVCPKCQAEMLESTSSRYYYPFTACRHCGGQYALFAAHPYVRANTGLRFFEPCPACGEELRSNPYRTDYPQISCGECGIEIQFTQRGETLLKSRENGYKALFEKAAQSLAAGGTLRVKTTTGYRVFSLLEDFSLGCIVTAFNAARLRHLFALIDEEVHALVSIERPVLHVAVADETRKSRLGSTVSVQYCDDGFAFLLGRELEALGIDAVATRFCTDETEADFTIDFDLPIRTQTPMHLFINKEVRFVAHGERGSFPALIQPGSDVACFAHGLAAIRRGHEMIVDQIERFGGTETTKVNALEGEELPFTHSNTHRIDQDVLSCMAVLHENALRHSNVVCAYFDESITFLYAKKGHITRVIPSDEFCAEGLIEKIASLREGSDRLIVNLRERHQKLYAVLETIEREKSTLFDAAAKIIALEGKGLDALMRESLRFVGKGGLQIDTKLRDNRFDGVAFLASIISYTIADVSPSLLSYSIFESLGDYFSDILTELKNRSKADHIALCGSGFANQSLYSRVQRNLKNTPPVLSRSFPIGRENGVVGGIYL
ncbi:MAG: hypothetical protein AB7S65_07955 [Sulfuricurvum sp.]